MMRWLLAALLILAVNIPAFAWTDQENQFFLAVVDGKTQKVEALLRDKPDLMNLESPHYGTAIHWAAQYGQVDVAKLLIKKGASVNVRNRNGQTPIDCASNLLDFKITSPRYKQIAAFLIANGAEVNSLNAACLGDTKRLNDILVKDPKATCLTDQHKNTPLHLAAEYNQLRIAEILIENKADINSINKDGATPLHSAASSGSRAVAELLIRKGAQIEVKDNDGWTPLHWAAEEGYYDVVKLLLLNKAVVDPVDKEGLTPLYEAAKRGHKDTASILLLNGAATNIFIASFLGDLDAIKKYLESDPKLINATDAEGWTPLHGAAYNGQLATAKILISKGANVNAINGTGWTPLHSAASQGHLSVVKLLVENGADVNAKDKDTEWTPLDLARDPKTAEYLDRHAGKK